MPTATERVIAANAAYRVALNNILAELTIGSESEDPLARVILEEVQHSVVLSRELVFMVPKPADV